MASDRFCVIMCGGAGTRFWPISRQTLPKQFIDFFGTGQTLLQLTAERVRTLIPQENIIIITNGLYANTVREQLPGIAPEHILLEPERRDTAPAVLWAARHIAARNPDASIVILPSDHVILKDACFHDALCRGFDFVEKADRLLALGQSVSGPNTARSYIQKADALNRHPDIFQIKTVADKPDKEMADIFVQSGEFVWNAGIYMGKASSIINAFSANAPELAARFDCPPDTFLSDREAAFIADIYPMTTPLPVEYAILDHVWNAYVLEADLGWSDLSTWNSLHEISPKNKSGNVTQNCRSMLYDCNDCIVTADGDKVVVAAGLKDYIIADSGNALLICPIESEQRIRNIVNDVRDRYGADYI